MATLDELVIRIKADASQLERELKRVGQTTRTATNEMGGALDVLKGQFAALVPALSVAAVVEFGRRAVDAAGHINDLAARIGFAAGTLSALEAGLASNGASLDDFGNAVNLMNANIGQAVSCSQEQIKAFDRLGLSVTALKQLSPEDQFYAITEALAGLENQYEQTEIGRAVFGRGFAALIPLIKESNGNLREGVQTVEAMGQALGPDTIQRVDAFGDALQRAGIAARNSFLEAFADILRVMDAVDRWTKTHNVDLARVAKDTVNMVTPALGSALRLGSSPPSMPSGATADQVNDNYRAWQAQQGFARFQVERVRGNNRDLLKSTAAGPPPENQLAAYVANLRQETAAIGLNERALFQARAEIEATAKAKEDFKNKLRDTKELTDQEKASIDQLAGAYYDQRKAAQEMSRFRDEITDGLTDIVLHFGSAKDAATSFFESLAAQAIKKNITAPLADNLLNLVSSSGGGLLSGVGSFFGISGARAAGGPVTGGSSYLVGERGPEIFTPGTTGTIIPNGTSTGGQISVTNVIQISPGVQGTVQAELQRALPGVINAAQVGTLAAIEKGGRAAQIVGKRG